jgi:hypothetical protein
LWVGLLLTACSELPADLLVIGPPRFGPGTAEFEVMLGSDVAPGTLEARLDGVTLRDPSLPGDRLRVEVAAGEHELVVQARRISEPETTLSARLRFTPPAALPTLLASWPSAGEPLFPRTEWIRLTLSAEATDAAIASVALQCEGRAQPIRIHRVDPNLLAIDPEGELSPDASCELVWRDGLGTGHIPFTTAPTGRPASIPYDRGTRRGLAPFPDDYWLVTNPADASEQRLRVELRAYRAPDQWLMNVLSNGVRELDGFSPVAHITIPLTAPADPESVPHTPEQSLDRLATVGLFDITPGSPEYATRVPFRLEVRSQLAAGEEHHGLLLYPSISLVPRHRYAVVVTRRVRVDPASPFEPSAFFRGVRDGNPNSAHQVELTRARGLADDVFAALAVSQPPIERADVAFTVRFTIRSMDRVAEDLMAMRQKTFDGEPPAIRIRSVDRESPEEIARGSEVAAIVHGTWRAPEWRTRERLLARDPETGAPTLFKTRNLQFVLALPRAALKRPVPVVMYQHGNPGSAFPEVVDRARSALASAGFAVIGFTDVINRELSPRTRNAEDRAQRQLIEILQRLLVYGDIADYFVQTVGEQLAFIRAIGEIAALEHFSIEQPDAGPPKRIFGIDGSQPLAYLGFSEGAHHGSMLLPFAPEIRAAALVSPGRRFSEVLLHQGAEQLLAPMSFVGFRQLSPSDIWVVLALIQTLFDRQDPHSYARFLYREPLALGSPRRASLLLLEGLDDSLIPNHATRALARAFGSIPQLGEHGRPVLGFEGASGAVKGNLDPQTSAAYYQYVPEGIEGVEATPGCAAVVLGERIAGEGHYCVQSAEESLRQVTHFFESALLEGAPEIIDPLTR